MARKISLRPRSNRTKGRNITPWICCECGKELHGQDRIILVDVLGEESARISHSDTKVKARRWFCNNYCLYDWLGRVNVRRVPR